MKQGMHRKKLLESIAASVHDTRRLRNAYLIPAHGMLYQQITG
jgi:hypothetical protein